LARLEFNFPLSILFVNSATHRLLVFMLEVIMRSLVVLLAVVAILGASNSSLLARTWTNVAGKKIEAEFLRVDGDKVILLIGEKETPVALDQLSEADQEFVRQQPKREEAAPLPDLTIPRIWTDKFGDTVTATFNGIDREFVLLVSGRQTNRIAYSEFSPADQDLIRRVMESRGFGLRIPVGAADLKNQGLRNWTDRTGKVAQGILRRIEPEGQIVLQLANTTLKLPYMEFSESDREYLRLIAEQQELSDNLPPDENMREWHDWKGEAFTARIDPSFPLNRMVHDINFSSPDKKSFKKQFSELSEADRGFLQALAQKAGNSKLKQFPEPHTPVRQWKIKGSSEFLEGKFVGMDEGYVILRIASKPEWSGALAAFSLSDRQYLRQELGLQLPLFADECRQWMYGPTGIGNNLIGQLESASGGIVRLTLPVPENGKSEVKSTKLAFLALSPDDQKFVSAELGQDYVSLLPKSNETLIADRIWTFDNGRETLSGPLVYVTSSHIYIGSATHRPIKFSELDAADQSYVCQMVSAHGQAKFDKPLPPPKTVRNSSAAPDPNYAPKPRGSVLNNQPTAPPKRGFSAFAAGSACGTVTLLVLIVFVGMWFYTRFVE
jgi:hypothetical protein